MMRLFYNDVLLTELEQNMRWRESIEYLSKKLDRLFDKHVLLRMAGQAWYVLMFWDCCMPNGKLTDKKFFMEMLKRTYCIADYHGLWRDADSLCLFGYFMIINQYLFSFLNNDITEVERMGKEMIAHSYELSPQNCLAKVVYYTEKGDKEEYLPLRRELQGEIESLFSGGSEIEKYFMEVLTML